MEKLPLELWITSFWAIYLRQEKKNLPYVVTFKVTILLKKKKKNYTLFYLILKFVLEVVYCSHSPKPMALAWQRKHKLLCVGSQL